MSRPPGRAALRAAESAPAPPAADDETTTGEGLHELVAELREWRVMIAPAAEAVAGFGARLDALCRWLKGKWPWILVAVWMALQQAANVTPQAATAALEAVAGVARAAGGGS